MGTDPRIDLSKVLNDAGNTLMAMGMIDLAFMDPGVLGDMTSRMPADPFAPVTGLAANTFGAAATRAIDTQIGVVFPLGGSLSSMLGEVVAAESAVESGALETSAGEAAITEGETVAGGSGSSPMVGTRRSPMEVEPGNNQPATIGGREYSGHALDRMQGRGQTPSVIENTIETGERFPGNTDESVGFFDPVNGTTAIIDTASGRVITVY